MQQLRAAELVALAEILRTTMDRFTWMQPEASATEYVYSAGTRVRRTSEDVSVAVHMLLSALSSAERTIEMTKDSKYERVHEARRDTAARIKHYDLERSVDEGIRRHEDRFGEDGEDDGEESDSDARGEP